MRMKLFTLLLAVLGSIFLIIPNSCKNDSQAEGTDKELYDMARETAGFTWYKKSEVLLNTTSGSGHSFPKLRTKYNEVAAVKLDANGKITAGTIFPQGSLIVKEFHDSEEKIGRYAVLYKNPDSPDADSKGWVWGYINADGTVAQAASKKGSGCSDCHNQSGNIDYMLMNKYFP